MAKILSLFDGSGGFPLAASLCGIEPAYAAEVEPYPVAVTRSRFPKMIHLGDVSKVHGGDIEPCDVVTFGSPCQDLSVAGKRAGLKHEANGDEETTRSGLFMEAVRIIKEMRESSGGIYPAFAVWENVPGAFSSQKGEDFRVVLEELVKIVEPTAVMPAVPKNGWPYADSYCGEGWSLSYRTLDAQYWGVPQRRRRIYLVLDLRGECAGKILFEREGLRGYFAEGRTPWKGIACDAERSAGADDRAGEGFDGYNGDLTGDVSSTLGINCGMSTGRNGVIECRRDGGNRGLDAVKPYTLKIRSGCEGGGKGALVQEDKSATLATNNDQYLFQPMAYSFDSLASNSMKSKNPHSGCRPVEVAKTLDTTDPNPCKNQGGIAIVEYVAFAQNQRDEVRDLHGIAGALAANPGMKQQTFIIDSIGGRAERGWEGEVAPCLKASHYKFPPVVTLQAAGFCTEHSAKARGVGYQEECAPTLRAGVTPAVVYSVENHPADSRVDIDDSGKVQTLTSRMGTGGGNVPMVMEPVVFDGANVTSPVNASNPQPGDPCHTLRTDSRNLLVAAGYIYCLQGAGATSQNSQGMGYKENTSYTLNTTDVHGVAYATDVGFFNSYKEQSPTLLARGYKDPHLVTYPEGFVHYIVRRLTPTECARLQGFPDNWGHPDKKDGLSDEEYKFWLEVRNTHARINGKAEKEYSREQMLTYYNKLHTDSAEYKMWGNGIALPCAQYVMEGIAEVLYGKK